MPLTLVLGGARSGKSSYAQRVAEERSGRTDGRLVLIATAEALDSEMAERIARHRAERGERWRTIEAPIDLADAISSLAADEIAVVDCLTLWLSNLLMHETAMDETTAALISTIQRSAADLILVSNEVGQGIVPENPLARRFRDEAGRLHQSLASVAERVVLIVAGLPISLKGGNAE